MARFRDLTARQHQKVIGTADDLLDADGVVALTFAQAQAKAREWHRTAAGLVGLGKRPGRYTVAQCVQDYLDHVKTHRKSGRHLETYAKAYILPRLGSVDTAELTTAMVRQWHQAIADEPPRLRTAAGVAQR